MTERLKVFGKDVEELSREELVAALEHAARMLEMYRRGIEFSRELEEYGKQLGVRP